MVRSDGEPVFVNGRVIGKVIDGVFTQRITDRHIYKELNAKGMDINLHAALQGKCEIWRLIHKKTHQVLSIPYYKIEIVGIKRDTGSGPQYYVPLGEFNEDRPVVQKPLF